MTASICAGRASGKKPPACNAAERPRPRFLRPRTGFEQAPKPPLNLNIKRLFELSQHEGAQIILRFVLIFECECWRLPLLPASNQ
jgi:hypothetical protein